MKFIKRAIRPSLDGDINKKVGLILLAHNLARTLSPLIGGYFADKYQKFKLIATIGYVAGKNKESADHSEYQFKASLVLVYSFMQLRRAILHLLSRLEYFSDFQFFWDLQ